MKKQIESKFFGVKEPPDVIIYFPQEQDHIILPSIKNFSHQLIANGSELRFGGALMNKDFTKYLQALMEGLGNLYFMAPIRSFTTGKDEWAYYCSQCARLTNYSFGTAADGDPAIFKYTFYGQPIERLEHLGYDKYIFDILMEETGYNYNLNKE